MSAEEIKTEILQAIDNVPEGALLDVLNYLKQLQNQSPDDIRLTTNLRKILLEDRGLLEKLAQ
ncbi:hypothetical protein BDD43_1765 [Mucilaginibacter gracilis]|uniref:Uncharacterized protein n=1 Tax=Mucilaginibacter gracilis TaxID=423350 RepID=A0A495IY35_9SPHI|nr:hypothetical protein [Mucilaginibacter gracilis]RKR81615.1 hypothetical protein BDD43_1765 [Mucilaginibacter gracilis]